MNYFEKKNCIYNNIYINNKKDVTSNKKIY